MAKEKSRFFAFLLYPSAEGFPADWEDRLERIGVPIAISPLHDKDKADSKYKSRYYEKYGYVPEFKKEHYHGIYVAKNPVTAESVRNKIRAILSDKDFECKAVAQVQIIRESIEGAYLYLSHESKDAIKKGKFIYDKGQIKHINNFDIERYITLDAETKQQYFDLIVQVVRVKKLMNILDLYDFIDAEGEDYGLDVNTTTEVLSSKVGIIKLLFDGNYQRYSRRKDN